MTDKMIIDWLLDNDVTVQYQVHKYLLNKERPDLREKIAKTGWGAKLLSLRNSHRDRHTSRWNPRESRAGGIPSGH